MKGRRGGSKHPDTAPLLQCLRQMLPTPYVLPFMIPYPQNDPPKKDPLPPTQAR